MGTRQTRSATRAQEAAQADQNSVSQENEVATQSSAFCQFLARDVGKMPIERHRAALLGCQAATVATLRKALAKQGLSDLVSGIEGTEDEREELVAVYLSLLHPGEHVDLEPVGSGPNKQTTAQAKVKRQPDSPAKKQAGAAGKSTAHSPFRDGETIEMERCKFRFGRVLGQGADSIIYEGACVEGKHAGMQVAIKVQTRHRKTTIQVTTECNVLTKLRQANAEMPRMQTLVAYGCVREKFYLLISKLLGPDLLRLLPPSQRLSPRNLLLAAFQGLEALEMLHGAGYVHRDIKPENLVTENPDGSGGLHLIDFGTAEALQDREGRRRSGPQAMEGTLPYMATSTHKKQALAKRDDVQSLAWTLLRLYQGSLPWDGLGMQQAAQVCSMKERWMAADGGDDDAVLKALRLIATHSAALPAEGQPDYPALRGAVEEAWGREVRKLPKTGGPASLAALTFLWNP